MALKNFKSPAAHSTFRRCLAPSRRSSPQAICTVSFPSSMLSRSLPAKLTPSYLHGFRSPSSMLSRSLPAKLSASYLHGFSPSSMLSRSLPAKLSESYLHGFLSVQNAVSLPPGEALRKLFPPFPVRPACCLAPSQRSFPQAICTVSSPSSMLSSLPPGETLCKLFPRFPFRPACCLAPSQRSSPQAICTVSCPSSMLSRSLPAKLYPSYLHGFLSVQHAVSLPPSEALRKLFPPFPVRPACCLAPSQRSFPQAICTVSSPSSMLSRSPGANGCIPAIGKRSAPITK